MERIKCKSFLDLTLEEQSDLIRSIQLTRSKSLKEASKKKVRKTTTKSRAISKSKSKTKSSKPKAPKAVKDHLSNLSQADLLELAKKHGIEI